MSLKKPIFIYDTLSSTRQAFTANNEQEVNIYSCGPTVYNYVHVGNARASIVADLVVRTFKLAGYKVLFARNYTDVDDKIINRATEENIAWQDLTEKFIKIYEQDCQQLKILDPDFKPKATDCIDAMVEMIQGLVEKKVAYVADTPYGSDVYFKTRSFVDYGKLSNRNIDDLESGARIQVGESKNDPLDFVLWKAAKPGEPSWPSPWGEGRPGWHIECSAMINKIFPTGLDVHMGGLDLIFPHHENEIAQSESCGCTKKLASYWIHNGMLVIGKEKMSKSLGNFYTANKFISTFGGEVLKLLCYQHDYRGPIDFQAETILRTEALLARIYNGLQICQGKNLQLDNSSNELIEQLTTTILDNFNTAKALGVFLAELRKAFRENSDQGWQNWFNLCSFFIEKFDLFSDDPQAALVNINNRKLSRLGITKEKSAEIDNLIELRAEVRRIKDYKKSDQIRDQLLEQGVLVMDGADGSSWTLKDNNFGL